jgi:hypothetical protein
MVSELIYSQRNFEDDINLAEVVIKELLLIIDDSHDELKSLLRDILSLIGYEKTYARLIIDSKHASVNHDGFGLLIKEAVVILNKVFVHYYVDILKNIARNWCWFEKK